MIDLRLDPLIAQIRHRLDRGTYLSQQAQLSYCVEDLTVELKSYVLAHQLPPETIADVITGTVQDQRFATWWDHFKATHRGRCWMRWRRQWIINYQTVEVPYRHTAQVTVRGHWTFPQARLAYPRELGEPVYIAITEAGTALTRRAP